MQENYSSTKFPTVATTGPGIGKSGGSPWTDPNFILVDDSDYSWWAASMAGQVGWITASGFGFPPIPSAAVIDGITVTLEGNISGATGRVTLNIPDTEGLDAGAMLNDVGGENNLWGAASISPSDIADLSVTVDVDDGTSGDGYAAIEYLTVTVYWHIEPSSVPADVPTRLAYKVYSRDGAYLGELPEVTTRFTLPQDINSAGSAIDISCAKDLRNVTEVDALLTEDGEDLLTEDDHVILAESTELLVTSGDSPDDALFKNSNRIKAWLYNYWHPNGKLMFSGQVNRITFSYASKTDYVNLRVYSDGHDLANYIARGFPFAYTTTVSQTVQNGYVVVETYADGGWTRYGQSWWNSSASNLGAIVLKLRGSALVTLDVFDAPGGNRIGSVTKSFSVGSTATDVQFEFPQLIPLEAGREYFMALSCPPGKNFGVFRSTANPYADGWMYISTYGGGSGGGGYSQANGDLYFIIKSGVPTTTTTYANADPVTNTMANILEDYNNRGGYIKKRNFESTGLAVTYTFNMATILDVIKKVLELSPNGYYAYVDVGTAEMDIKRTSTTPDFTVVRGRDLEQLDISLTIEQVKNYLLFTGGETAGVNLYRDYQDARSAANYGIRTVAQTDNRVKIAATADAIGESFIEASANEEHETQITVLNKNIDITLLTPGKTVGFANFGNFIDDLVLQIVRREYTPDAVTLTLGRLPLTLSAEVQRITRELLNEQTANNPSSPS